MRGFSKAKAVRDDHAGELRRIAGLPRRTYTAEALETLVDRLTAALKTTAGTMRLRPIQAQALIEIGRYRGGLFPIRVGGGKTLISLLAPRMVPGVQRPLLLLPAALKEKTRREEAVLRHHWILPPFVRVESYTQVSTDPTFLERYRPDFVFCDEVHYLKDPSSARTRRVARYLKQYGHMVTFVGASGTITKRSIKDFAHLSNWALGDLSPVPADFIALDEWSRALDVNVAAHRRLLPGELRRLGDGPVREVYRERLVSTPGVVATQEPPLPIALTIRSHVLETPEADRSKWASLRQFWETPDGWPCSDGVEVWRHAKEMAAGCWYRWDPRPPAEWMAARSAWSATVRDLISTNRRNLDTQTQITQAVHAGHYPQAEKALADWEAVRDSFEPNVDVVWFHDRAVDWIKAWGRKAPGLIWVHHRGLGERLSKEGLPYYSNKGVDKASGRFVEDHDPAIHGPAVLSIEANKEGRNLQHRWGRNLIVGVPPNGSKWEQLLGRTHRDGQPREEVTADVLFGCREDIDGFWTAVEDSGYMEEMTGQAHKLVHADTSEVHPRGFRPSSSPQWEKNS